MGELSEQRWAVVSERGCEAAGLTYDAAAELARRLTSEKVHALCIVTDEAARRLTGESDAEGTPAPPVEAHRGMT